MKNSYDLIKKDFIEEINSNAVEYKHYSGARVLLLENDDNEKSFSISFKTPPEDDSGVFHILEHSVLCGSKKFPVKEPFTNLLQSSMQTFLNAFTFDDKTMYPVATTNEKDLYNLMEVYLDAVFFPNLCKDINIFYQEGGHKTKDGFSGIVYNEMQGVYADSTDELMRRMSQCLFPDTNYKYSSGGYPKSLRELTYEKFLENYRKHYRLDNCYIIAYGNFNPNKLLDYLDKEYLSKKEQILEWRGEKNSDEENANINSDKKYDNKKSQESEKSKGHRKINFQEPVDLGFKQYKIQTNPENGRVGLGYVIQKDKKEQLAISILIDVLAGSNEAPLKKAILKSNLCKDVNFIYSSGILQPTIFIEFKSVSNTKKIKEKLRDFLQSIIGNGIDKKLIGASIARSEFLLKEKTPVFSPGIDAALDIMSEWLYDEKSSTLGLKQLDLIEDLKNELLTDYFDKLATDTFINNKHCCFVEIIPTDKPQDKVCGDTSQEVEEICARLREKQEAADTQENLDKLPCMEKSDIGPIEKRLEAKINTYCGFRVLDQQYKLKGISYINRYYDLKCMKWEDLGYVSLLSDLLGKLNTKNFSALQIDTLVTQFLGHFTISCSTYENYNDTKDVDLKLKIKSAALSQNTHKLASLVDEIIFNTKFDNIDKIKSIVEQIKIGYEQNFVNNGHIYATSHAMACLLPSYKLSEKISGIDYYKFIKNLKVDEDLCNKLSALSKKIFSVKPIISFSGSKEAKKTFFDILQKTDTKNKQNLIIPDPKIEEKAYIIPSNVCYSSIANHMSLNNIVYNGCYMIACNALNYGYLWDEVRVKNGAYGVGISIAQTGAMRYFSYRDPKLKSTFDAFINSGKHLEGNELTNEAMTGYIISSVAKIDAPKTTSALITIADNNFLCHCDGHEREKIREDLLSASKQDIVECAKNIYKMSVNGIKCVFGGKNIISESDLEVEELF